MLIKMTKMALAGALIVGAASVALAGNDNTGEYSGGYQVQTRQDIQNAKQPKANAGAAFALVPAAKQKLPAPQPTIAHHEDWAPCPTLEGYPDCH